MTIDFEILEPKNSKTVLRVKWPKTGQTFTTGDKGTAINLSEYNDTYICVFGTPGGGATTMRGTGDPRGNPTDENHNSTAWAVQKDSDHNEISYDSYTTSIAKDDQLLNNPDWLSPEHLGGAAADVIIILTAKKGK